MKVSTLKKLEKKEQIKEKNNTRAEIIEIGKKEEKYKNHDTKIQFFERINKVEILVRLNITKENTKKLQIP